MKKRLLLLLALSALSCADEYDFDMGAIEQTPYEYGGYVRFEDRAQRLNNENEDTQNYARLEGLLDFSYAHDIFTFNSSTMATYDYVEDNLNKSGAVFNDLYIEAKLNTNHSLLVGKESLKWGKGYFFNPVAFFDRPKDPTNPILGREGFVIAKYNYNKSFDSQLKNLSLDLVYLPSTKEINTDYYNLVTDKKDANNAAMRLYMLIYDMDIDFIYNYSDVASDKIGIDFSKNVQTNFEIHGEYANVLDSGYSYLLGLRYLTEFELTITSEYLYNSKGLDKEEIEASSVLFPFVAKDYFITLATQKEPLDILYLSVYCKNMTNMQDHSMQNKVGAEYSFKNDLDLDLSYNLNSGGDKSEFGKKAIKDFLWLRLTWNF